MSGLTSAQVENRDATEAATKAIYEQTNAHLGLRGAQLNTRDSLDSYNQVLGNSASTDVQKQKALLSVEQAFYQQEQAAYQAAYADSKATTEAGKVAEAQAAANRETVNLADSFKGPLPESLQETISKMDLTSARAAGLTVDVDKVGDAVYRLPDGKEIKITAPTDAAQEQIDTFIDRNNNRAIAIRVDGLVTYRSDLSGIAATKQALGGIVEPFAGGGVASALRLPDTPPASAFGVQRFDDGGFAGSLTPMSAVAQIVGPQTWRVVGDRLTDDEAYIPLVPGSRRSQDILTEAMARMGRSSEPTQVVNNVTYNHHYHITTLPQDPQETASAVAREVVWGLR